MSYLELLQKKVTPNKQQYIKFAKKEPITESVSEEKDEILTQSEISKPLIILDKRCYFTLTSITFPFNGSYTSRINTYDVIVARLDSSNHDVFLRLTDVVLYTKRVHQFRVRSCIRSKMTLHYV